MIMIWLYKSFFVTSQTVFPIGSYHLLNNPSSQKSFHRFARKRKTRMCFLSKDIFSTTQHDSEKMNKLLSSPAFTDISVLFKGHYWKPIVLNKHWLNKKLNLFYSVWIMGLVGTCLLCLFILSMQTNAIKTFNRYNDSRHILNKHRLKSVHSITLFKHILDTIDNTSLNHITLDRNQLRFTLTETLFKSKQLLTTIETLSKEKPLVIRPFVEQLTNDIFLTHYIISYESP